MADAPVPYVPVNPPPTEYTPMNVGLGTELGDNAKTAFQKINAGFAHVYSLLKQAGVAVATPAAAIGADVSGLEARIKALESKPLPAFEAAAKGDLDALIAKVKALESGATVAPGAASADLDKVKAELADVQSRFGDLASKMEVFFGLKKA